MGILLHEVLSKGSKQRLWIFRKDHMLVLSHPEPRTPSIHKDGTATTTTKGGRTASTSISVVVLHQHGTRYR